GWTQVSSGGFPIIDASWPHSGTQSAFLCGYNNCQEEIRQTIAIPADASRVSLSFYWYSSTNETSHPWDTLAFEVRSQTGLPLGTVVVYYDGDATGVWTSAAASLDAYRGQTVQL